jgi:signal transduction histidine kinase
MAKNSRNLSNFLLTPQFQLKLTYYYIGVGVSIIIATVATVFYKMALVQDIMNNRVIDDYSSQDRITEQIFQIAQVSMLGFVTFAVASFIFALMVSHRIAGPVVAITAFINELKQGNYRYGRKLRPNDELTIIMDGLHDLSAVLQEQQEQQDSQS